MPKIGPISLKYEEQKIKNKKIKKKKEEEKSYTMA